MPQAVALLVLAGQAAIAAAASAGGLWGITITTTQAIIASAALSVVGAIAQGYLARRNRPKATLQPGEQVIQQPIPDRVYAVGLVRLGGALAYYNTGEDGGDYPSRIMAATVHAAHRINRYVDVYVADNKAVFDEGGNVTSRPYNGLVRIEKHLGTADQAASGFLSAASPTEWTAAHRMRGLAYTVTGCRPAGPERHYKIYDSGPPATRSVIEAALVYDPRDGAQSVTDPSTYEWSKNYALNFAWFLCGVDEAGVPVGFGLGTDEIDWPSVAAAATVSDQDVVLKAGGTIKRWEASGSWDASEPMGTILADFLATGGGRLDEGPDGKVRLRVGEPDPTPTVTITDDMCYSWSLRQGSPIIDRVNEIRGRFMDPTIWQEVEAGIQSDTALIALTGRTISAPLEPRFLASDNQTQRVAAAELRRNNPSWSGTITGTLQLLDAYGERWITLRLAELGIDQTFEVRGWSLNRETMAVTLTLTSYDGWWSWDPEADERDPVVIPVEQDRNQAAAPAAPDVIVQSRAVDGVTSAAVAVIGWPDPPRDGLTARARWRVVGSAGWLEDVATSDVRSLETGTLRDGATYEAQIMWVSVNGNASEWSATTTFLAVADQTPPPAPALSSMGAVGSSITGYLDVPDDDHAYRGIVQIDTDPAFGSPDTAFGPRVATPGARVTLTLGPYTDGTYHLRARCTNRSGVAGPWSASVEITVDTGGGP